MTDVNTIVNVEQFQLANTHIALLDPAEDPGVDRPQVALILDGHPAHLTGDTGRRYITFTSPQDAISIGEALAEAGRAALTLEAPAPAPAASGLVTATTADMRAVAAQHDQVQKLR